MPRQIGLSRHPNPIIQAANEAEQRVYDEGNKKIQKWKEVSADPNATPEEKRQAAQEGKEASAAMYRAKQIANEIRNQEYMKEIDPTYQSTQLGHE